VLANLPYVAESEWPTLAPELTKHEPREALVAGPTGLEAIEGLLGRLAVGDLDTPAVGLEVGAGQAAAVAELVRRAGFERVEIRPDLAGIERVVVGRR
jgi:release factor glutamine methyltransferase